MILNYFQIFSLENFPLAARIGQFFQGLCGEILKIWRWRKGSPKRVVHGASSLR
jgi:hypothetical protein